MGRKAKETTKEQQAEPKDAEAPIVKDTEPAKEGPKEEKKKPGFMIPKDTGEQIAEILKTPSKEQFAPAEEILILEIEEDGRAKYIPARWTGKSEVLTDEVTKRIYKLTTEEVEPPPFFEVPHQVATNPISLFFLSCARLFGMKTVWHRALLFLPNNNKPFNWKKQRQDPLSGKEWNATVDMSAMSVANTMFQKQGTSSMILYILIGLVLIGIFAVIAMLMGG